MRTARRSAVLLAAAVSACGFHFAGNQPLPEPLQKVYVDVIVPYHVAETPLESSLRTRLLRRGATLVTKESEARAVLRLTQLKESRQVLSVGTDGKAIEYQLTTHVTYELIAGKTELVPAGELEIARGYSFNAEQVLAKQAEEDRLRAYIQDDLAEMLLLRLEILLKKPAPAAAPATG